MSSPHLRYGHPYDLGWTQQDAALRLPGELPPMLQEIKKNLRAKRYARPE